MVISIVFYVTIYFVCVTDLKENGQETQCLI